MHLAKILDQTVDDRPVVTTHARVHIPDSLFVFLIRGFEER
jgi:hypothetical protein